MANKKITDLSSLTSLASGDLFEVVDISDTTDDSTGSSKKITASNIKSFVNSDIVRSPYVVIGTDVNCDYICDGTADDVQFSAAWDAVIALGGGIIFVKPGTYNFSSSVTKTSNNGVSIIGSGIGVTTIKISNSANISCFTLTSCDNIIFSNFTGDGNISNNTTSVIVTFTTCDNVKIENLLATNSDASFRFTGCNYIDFKNIRGENSSEIVNSSNMLQFFTSHYINIIGGSFNYSYLMPINFQAAGGGCSDVYICGVKVLNSGLTNLNALAYGIYTNTCQKIKIEGCTVIGTYRSGIYIFESSHSSVIGNYVENAEIGIDVDQDSHYTTVSANVCVSNRYYGIWVGDSYGVSIVGNTAQNNNVSEAGDSVGAGIVIGGAVATKYCVVAGNVIVDSAYPLKQLYSIYEFPTYADYNIITNNSCVGYVTAGVLKSGANSVSANNIEKTSL